MACRISFNSQAPARPRSGWSNKTGSVLQLPGLLWEPTPKRPKRLPESRKKILIHLFIPSYLEDHSGNLPPSSFSLQARARAPPRRAIAEPHAHFPHHIQHGLLCIPPPPAEARPRSGWSNKTGSVLQLPVLLWEPTPKRRKRLLETAQTKYAQQSTARLIPGVHSRAQSTRVTYRNPKLCGNCSGARHPHNSRTIQTSAARH